MATDKPKADDLLYDDLCAAGMPPVREHMFHSERGWRFDLSYPPLMLAVEVDGRGRHQSPKGYAEDAQKLNAATELGWKILRYPTRYVTTNKRRERIVEQIRRIAFGVTCEDSAACVLVGE